MSNLIRRRRVVALFLALTLAELPAAPASAACLDTDFVVADRSTANAAATVDRALGVVADEGNGGTPALYAGPDQTAFFREVEWLKPKVVVAHFSMFAPGSERRAEPLSAFFGHLESTVHPAHYVIYGSAFFLSEDNPDPLTEGDIRIGQDNQVLFSTIPDERLDIIPVPKSGRFSEGKGRTELEIIVRKLLENGLCE